MFAPSVALPSGLSSQYHAQDEAGQYTFGYANDVSSKVQYAAISLCCVASRDGGQSIPLRGGRNLNSLCRKKAVIFHRALDCITASFRNGIYLLGPKLNESSFPIPQSETKTLDGVTRGSYSYVDPHGQIQTRSYVADEGGFRVVASDLPQANV